MNLILAAVLSLGVDTDYASNYQDAVENQKPLVVVVGAEWCGGCRIVKALMPRIFAKIPYRKINYAIVDTEEQPKLAKKILVGEFIPQTVIYYRNKEGEWKNYRWIGILQEQEVINKIEEINNAQ